MIPTLTREQKQYRTAKERFLEPALIRFVEHEFPQIGGPLVIKLFVEKILEQINAIAPLQERIQPGQMVWNALDIHTRADHPRRKTKSVILTIVTAQETTQLEHGTKPHKIIPERIARLCNEAYGQGALLSMRDIGVIFMKDPAFFSSMRINYEKEQNIVLPHTGSLHDQGSTITHKAIICKKVKQEHKDSALVAKETNHSQKAVDNYLQGFERTQALKELNKSTQEISFLTGMSKQLVTQYEKLIDEFKTKKVELSTESLDKPYGIT